MNRRHWCERPTHTPNKPHCRTYRQAHTHTSACSFQVRMCPPLKLRVTNWRKWTRVNFVAQWRWWCKSIKLNAHCGTRRRTQHTLCLSVPGAGADTTTTTAGDGQGNNDPVELFDCHLSLYNCVCSSKCGWLCLDLGATELPANIDFRPNWCNSNIEVKVAIPP